jgi:hypothetical protein
METTIVIISIIGLIIVGILFGPKIWASILKEECKHQWGPITNGYQYCAKCNLAKATPVITCEHDWQVEKENRIQRPSFTIKGELNTIGSEIMYKCSKCSQRKYVRTEISKDPVVQLL